MSASIPAGYKQTDVGVIPGNWEVSTVGCEFEIKLGKMIDAEKNLGVLKPYIGNKAVQWDRIDISDLPQVPMSRVDIERFRLQSGDLLVCEGGEVGRSAIWHSPIGECYYQKALHRLRPLRGFDSRLMAALLRQWSDRGQLVNYVTQTSIAHLPREKFLEIPMSVPPPSEQRAIATALSDVDALLAKLDQLIAKKRELKQAAMQQLLTGQTRLPGFSGAWEVKRLGGVASATKGSQLKKSESGDIGKFAHLNGGITPSGFTEFANTPGQTIAISEGGNSCGFVQFMAAPFWSGGHCYSIVPTRIDKGFLYQALKGKQDDIMGLRVGSGLPNVQKSALLNFSISCPLDRSEQIAIATLLSDMDTELAALEARAAKTRALKQGMMQELLTGRIRLLAN
jgi:type I restriction enzyme, S subunit